MPWPWHTRAMMVRASQCTLQGQGCRHQHCTVQRVAPVNLLALHAGASWVPQTAQLWHYYCHALRH